MKKQLLTTTAYCVQYYDVGLLHLVRSLSPSLCLSVCVSVSDATDILKDASSRIYWAHTVKRVMQAAEN